VNLRSKKPKIVIVGDSHARGAAGEIKHQTNGRTNSIGYVKPNAGLAELINTAKSVSSNMTKSESLVLIGGSNDLERNNFYHNITSLAHFLRTTTHTNVILTEVPTRYDSGARPHINWDIEKYNMNLREMIKGFQHTTIISVTHNREMFTRHGLHLNGSGKELLSRTILRIQAATSRDKTSTSTHRTGKDVPTSKRVLIEVLPYLPEEPVGKTALVSITSPDKKTEEETPVHVNLIDKLVPQMSVSQANDSLIDESMTQVRVIQPATQTPDNQTAQELQDSNTPLTAESTLLQVTASNDRTGHREVRTPSRTRKEDHKVNSSATTNVGASMEDAVQDESSPERPRVSTRQKKPPTTRSHHFLW
jgi:hypothetical protein